MKTIKLIMSMSVMFMSFIFLYRSMTVDGLVFTMNPFDPAVFSWLIGLVLFLIAGTMGVTASQNDDRKINLTTSYFYIASALVTLIFAQKTLPAILLIIFSAFSGALFLLGGLMMEAEAMDLNWYSKKSRERIEKRSAQYQRSVRRRDNKKVNKQDSYHLGEPDRRKTGRKIIAPFLVTSLVVVISVSAGLVSYFIDQDTSENYSDYNQVEEDYGQEETVDVYEMGQTWTVENDFAISFTAANETSFRNEYADFDPAQVVILTYDYSNLGHEKDTMDLYISAVNLYVLDENDEWGEMYPVTNLKYPEEIAIGESCTGAQEGFGLYNASQEVWVYVEVYGNDYEYYAAYFWLPVQAESIV
ncbi:LapA family protein [Eubacteriaceae bacterium ES2]|nr:LapA family protein [Eubacteriaceae bacterium ES2]